MKSHSTFSTGLLIGWMLFWLVPMADADPVSAGASIQIIAFSYNGSERELSIADAKGTPMTPKPVKLPMYQCSEPLPVSSRDLQFTLVKEGQDAADGKSGQLSGAGKPMQVSLTGAGKDYVLVFLPLPSERGGGYKIHAVELPAERFKSGSYAFINYTDTEIYCGLDKQKLVVAPAKAGILSSGAVEGVVRTACFEKSGSAWSERPFFSSRVPIQKGVRNLVLISRDPASGRIDFRGVPDFISQ